MLLMTVFVPEPFAFVNSFLLRATGFGLRVTGFCLRVNGFRLRVNGFRLRVKGFRLRGNGFRLKVWGPGKGGRTRARRVFVSDCQMRAAPH